MVKRIENFASFIFRRQIDELTTYTTDETSAYTEENFDKDLTQVLQHKEKGTELEYIAIFFY